MAISKADHSNQTREHTGQNKEETEIKLTPVFDQLHLILHSTTHTHDN